MFKKTLSGFSRLHVDAQTREREREKEKETKKGYEFTQKRRYVKQKK